MKRALDLFCCAGGATRGLQLAGYHVTGVDIKPQKRYIGDRFIQADAMEVDWHGYDLIWASPPCQRYSEATPKEYQDNHPDLLPQVLDRLRAQDTPYICENVETARHLLYEPIMLCGSMFGLGVWRHRFFEMYGNPLLLVPPCLHLGNPVIVSGRSSRRRADGRRIGRYPMPEKYAAMGVDWMTSAELSEAIPPAYSKFLAEQIDLWR